MNQHSIDFYHHTARGLRGTDEFQWCLHQLAALKAQQASIPQQPQPPFAPGDTFTRGKARNSSHVNDNGRSTSPLTSSFQRSRETSGTRP